MSIYIEHDTHRIYIDNSTRVTFDACKEKARLQNVIGYQLIDPGKQMHALDFGHAFHAGLAAYYDSLALPPGQSGVALAKRAFVADCKRQESTLPIPAEDGRSLERGMMLLEAYIERWKGELYENILKDGKPLTELYFETPVARYQEWDILLCGTIDRIMRHMASGRPAIFECKTTGKGLSQFIQECKPNSQIDSYFMIAWRFMEQHFPDLPKIAEAVWDATFVSSRKPDIGKSLKQRYWMWGIDIESDFARQVTTRSKTDISEFLIDLEETAVQFAKWLLTDAKRWPRSKSSTTCHLYGGCAFRNVCNVNGDNAVLSTFYEIRPWDPRKRMTNAS